MGENMCNRCFVFSQQICPQCKAIASKAIEIDCAACACQERGMGVSAAGYEYYHCRLCDHYVMHEGSIEQVNGAGTKSGV